MQYDDELILIYADFNGDVWSEVAEVSAPAHSRSVSPPRGITEFYGSSWRPARYYT